MKLQDAVDAGFYICHNMIHLSAILLVNANAVITTIKRQTGYKSMAVAEGNIENSFEIKLKI